MVVFFAIKTILLLVTLMLALYHDYREQKIKNYTTFTAAFLGLLINFIEQGSGGMMFSLKGWIVPVALLVVFYYMNVMGAGDIKLFAAIGAIMGLPFALYSIAYSIYAGGLIALFILLMRKEFKRKMKSVYHYFKYITFTGKLSVYCNKDDLSSKFIFSAAIVPGTILQLLCQTLSGISG